MKNSIAFPTFRSPSNFGVWLILFSLTFLSCSQQPERDTIPLNGTWDLTVEPAGSGIPDTYDGTVPVPGLGDMASFSIDSFGLPFSIKRNLWYRKQVSIGAVEDRIVTLKIHRAKFGHTLYVNGSEAGSSEHCFSASEYDITELLHEHTENEIVVRVGAYPDNLEEPVIWGSDFEKLKYQPGIYDDVELILSGTERLDNVQVAPDPDSGMLRVGVVMTRDRARALSYNILEKGSGLAVQSGRLRNLQWDDSLAVIEIPFQGARLWTPEDPFLYTLELESANDTYTTTFGMRLFRFNTETGRAELNGETYFMRGTNVCLFRFFEDPDRDGLPWDTAWVRKLHRIFKSMHWNSIRYCISSPPGFWYDIADEEGFLIQDEYPVWTGTGGGFERIYPDVTATSLAEEYRSWMKERWNHPCIVIWDAQNESVTEVVGEAIGLVRGLDMSGRPWENGWAAPQAFTDPVETHPYRFTEYLGRKAGDEGPLKELFSEAQVPDNGPSERMPAEDGQPYPNPIIINEYGWLWLNRDGTTTTLTDRVYPNAFGPGLTIDEQLELYGRSLGIVTEYWRAHRTSAGVLHFCGLGYSRSAEPRGQTSDHFTDIRNLVLQPDFVRYVRPAFHPVGLFLDWFEQEVEAGAAIEVPVIVINDLNRKVEMEIILRWVGEGLEEVAVKKQLRLDPFGKVELTFSVTAPDQAGNYELVLETEYDGELISGIRRCDVR